ncbi:MAG TPA: sodium:solute symporter family protein [Hyphomicrobiaceae bacterium]|nr:sodium:solute symporter family protein [Hyphomicrobiaceae bacterium]
MGNLILWLVIGYILVQFAIGVLVSRSIRNETDYILAGRSLGVGLAGFSVFATWFGAETVTGSAGSVFKSGLSGAQGEPFAYAVGIILMGLFVAGRLWRAGITTFGDFFRNRFSPTVEVVVAVLLVPGSVLWAAAQIYGFGQIVASVANIDTRTAITIGAVTVVAYTVVGGLLADAWTDVIQGIVIIVGLLMLLFFVLAKAGGFSAGLAAIEPARWSFMVADQPWLEFIEQWAVPICGSLVAVELISRILGARSAGVASTAAISGGVLYLLVALIPVVFGLLGPKLLPSLPAEQSEQLVAELAKAYLPAVLSAVFIGALISAILSTVDSALLAAGSLVSHNILLRLNPDTSDRGKVVTTRVTVAVLGATAYVIALAATSIKELVELASAFASAGVFVALIFGLFTRFGGPQSALAAILAGAVIWGWGRFVFELKTPYLAGLGAAVLAYVVVAVLERRDQRLEA